MGSPPGRVDARKKQGTLIFKARNIIFSGLGFRALGLGLRFPLPPPPPPPLKPNTDPKKRESPLKYEPLGPLRV